jgi:hypothetical protein
MQCSGHCQVDETQRNQAQPHTDKGVSDPYVCCRMASATDPWEGPSHHNPMTSPHSQQASSPITPCTAAQAVPQAGTRLIQLPRSCHLTYDESSDPRVLTLIQQVPEELWGAKLALQVREGGVWGVGGLAGSAGEGGG